MYTIRYINNNIVTRVKHLVFIALKIANNVGDKLATKSIGQIWKRGKNGRTRKINNMKRNEGIRWKVFLSVKYWPMKKAEICKTLNHLYIFGIKNKRVYKQV